MAVRLRNMTPIITGIIRTRIATKQSEISRLLQHQETLSNRRDLAMVERHRVTCRIYTEQYNATFFTLDSYKSELDQLKRDLDLCLTRLQREQQVKKKLD